jgi:mercuric ion binding protein
MKKLFFLYIVFVFASFSAGADNKVATINIKASIYCDHCKKCKSCGSRLEKAVYTQKGIKRVDIDETSKTVSVIYSTDKTSPEKIRQAIALVGFDADDVKADPKAYEKLDDCCKK